jgi:hypothetical protein
MEGARTRAVSSSPTDRNATVPVELGVAQRLDLQRHEVAADHVTPEVDALVGSDLERREALAHGVEFTVAGRLSEARS